MFFFVSLRGEATLCSTERPSWAHGKPPCDRWLIREDNRRLGRTSHWETTFGVRHVNYRGRQPGDLRSLPIAALWTAIRFTEHLANSSKTWGILGVKIAWLCFWVFLPLGVHGVHGDWGGGRRGGGISNKPLLSPYFSLNKALFRAYLSSLPPFCFPLTRQNICCFLLGS